jgi:hypothetical protein
MNNENFPGIFPGNANLLIGVLRAANQEIGAPGLLPLGAGASE